VTDATVDVAAMPAKAPERASLQDWIAVVAGALGALIASLDISIVNSALPQIQGEIGASGTEGTWIATGYLVSEVVMIPLAAWLTRCSACARFCCCAAACSPCSPWSAAPPTTCRP
jgi:DHA2 family multidrug resistance protein